MNIHDLILPQQSLKTKLYTLNIRGTNGCIVGSTLIDVPRDLVKYPLGIPIQELVGKETLVYSYDEYKKQMCLRKGFNIRKTGEKIPVYKLTYESKIYGITNIFTEIILTGDHKCLLRNGKYCPVIKLKVGDSLMPFYRTIPDGYSKIDLNNGKRVYEHLFILSELGETSEEGHHRDRNKLNNSCDNLDGLTVKQHRSLHYNDKGQHDKMLKIVKTNHPKGMLGKSHTKETKDLISKKVRQSFGELIRIARCLKIKKKRRTISEETRRKLSEAKKGRSPWNSGIVYSIEERKKISEGLQKYYKEHPEARQHISEIQKGRIGFMKGKHHSKEAKKKMSEAKKNIWNHKVISVKFHGYEDVYDIEVENTHNFVANGIVIHNSGKTSLARRFIETDAKATELFVDGLKKVAYTYCPTHNVILIGGYRNKCGGADTMIKAQIVPLLKLAWMTTANIIFEGVLVANSKLPYYHLMQELNNTIAQRTYGFVYLELPWKLALLRIYQRNGGKPIKEQYVFNKHADAIRYKQWHEQQSDCVVLTIDATKSIDEMFESLLTKIANL